MTRQTERASVGGGPSGLGQTLTLPEKGNNTLGKDYVRNNKVKNITLQDSTKIDPKNDTFNEKLGRQVALTSSKYELYNDNYKFDSKSMWSEVDKGNLQLQQWKTELAKPRMTVIVGATGTQHFSSGSWIVYT